MKTTFQTITGRDVHHNAVLFLYNHANAWDTQTIRNECLQSKWRSLSDFAVMARWIQDVIFICTCVARWGDNQWKEMLISIFSCFTWSQIPPIAAGAPSCQPHLIFLLSQQPNTNALSLSICGQFIQLQNWNILFSGPLSLARREAATYHCSVFAGRALGGVTL